MAFFAKYLRCFSRNVMMYNVCIPKVITHFVLLRYLTTSYGDHQGRNKQENEVIFSFDPPPPLKLCATENISFIG